MSARAKSASAGPWGSRNETSSSSSADVKVGATTANNASWVAKAQLAMNGKPGSYVTINKKYNYYGASKKKNTIAHELGHIIGFAHTNGKSSVGTKHIEGTRTTAQSSSVMYRYTHSWNGFTNDDKIAAQVTFPQ